MTNVWQRCADKLPDEGVLVEVRGYVGDGTAEAKRTGDRWLGSFCRIRIYDTDEWRYATNDTK